MNIYIILASLALIAMISLIAFNIFDFTGLFVESVQNISETGKTVAPIERIRQQAECPSSCDDNNACTSDWCNETSDYLCSHSLINGTSEGCWGNPTICSTTTCISGKCTEVSIKNCCGNNICESSENCNSCSIDCGECPLATAPTTTIQTIIESPETSQPTPMSQSNTIPNRITQTPKLYVNIVAAKSLIVRGNNQTITITVLTGNDKIDQAYVSSVVTYASGTQQSFNGTTDSNGTYNYTWRIGGNSKTGTFIVTAVASKVDYETGNSSITFEVISAS